jgi:hypothetical protein
VMAGGLYSNAASLRHRPQRTFCAVKNPQERSAVQQPTKFENQP